MKPGVSAVWAGTTKGHPAHLQQVAVALDLLKVPEDPLALLAGRSVHLPGAVALLAQTAMGAAVHLDAAQAGVVPEDFPAVAPPGASPAAIHPEALPVVIPLEGAVVTAEVAEAVDQSQLINSKEDHLILFFLSVVDRDGGTV